MENIILVQRNDDENLVPNIWRRTFYRVVEALRTKDYYMLKNISEIHGVTEDEMNRLISNIQDYGCHLISLPEETWSTSVCRWGGGGIWDVMVDLYTLEEGRSDLVLTARVFEKGNIFSFEIIDIYVP